MKFLVLFLVITSARAQEICNHDNGLEIKNTSFEEKVIEHDPSLCFNKEKLKELPDLSYREKLKKSFNKIDKLYPDKLELTSGKSSPLSAFRTIDPELGLTEVLGLTRLDTQSEKINGRNRSWDYYGLEGRGRTLRVRSPIHDFIGKSKHIDKEKLTNKVIQDMDRYNQKFKCQYGTQIVNLVRIRRISKDALANTDIKSKYKSSKEFKESLKENKLKIDKIFNKEFPKEEGITRNYNCAEDYDQKNNSIAYKAEDSCNVQISHQFANNSAEISQEALKENPGYKKFTDCISKKKLTQKLIDISIRSSANSIRNSGNTYSKYNWRELSKDRALNAAKVLQKAISPKESFNKWKDKYVNLTTTGTNGDGTSGPCALEWNNGKVQYKKEFSTPEGKKSLDKFKSVYLSARFTQNTKAKQISPSFYYQKRCNEIGYKCREYTPNDQNLAKRKKSIRRPEVFRSPNQF